MQPAQDSFFYHSNSRLGADGGLRHERQLLVEEQKLCRARARKFSLETIRRRKVLEERRKQWDAQEQRLRENILQQRRQRVQSATERFQRAHLPPSQRRRQCFRRNVPNVEDALNQIQGAFNSYSRQSSFLSSNSNVSRSCTPSPKPPTVSKSSHRHALSAVEAYTKLLQEQSMTCLRSSQQAAEQTQEKQQDRSPQDSYLSDCCNSESLSSKDSLENEDPNQSAKNLQSSFSSFFLNSEKPLILCGDDLPQSREEHEPKQKNQEDSEGPDSKMHVSKASWGFTSVVQSPDAETQPALHDCNRLTLCEIMSADPEHFERKSPQNSPNDNAAVTDRVAPGIAALQSSCLKQEVLSDVTQQKVHDDRQLKHPSATEILLPAKNGNRKDILFGTSPKPNIFLDDITTDNASQEAGAEKLNHNLSLQKETNASINNLNKVSKPKTDKPINTASLQHACLSNIQKVKCLECPEEEEQKVPVSVGISHSVCQVRFIKGILKKQSKYISGDTACMYGAGHLIFAKEVALAIRDSVELTRTKTSDSEGNSAVKKKLRWFDEVHVGKDKEQNAAKQMKGKSSNISLSNNNSEDHQLSLASVSGASKSGPSVTPPAYAGYHFTKQAWADVGVQVSLPQQRADEVKVPWSATRPGGPKVPWRERSARAGAGPVSSRPRKGTVMRPQSATEVSQIAKAQGKIIAPRPPPRMEAAEEKTPYVTKTPYGTDNASVICKQTLAAEQTAQKHNSEGFFSPYTHHAIRTDSTVMYTPLPPSCTCPISEGSVKGTPSSGHQETQGSSRRRATAYNEKGLCLECTPTEEDISQLWHGVRSALATKDAKTVLRRQALESGRVIRKPFVEQSRQPPGSGNRRFLQPSQPTKQTAEPVRLFPTTYDLAFPDEGLESATRLHLAEERDIVAAMETAQTQRPAMVQRGQQQGLATISLEEQKILLSLDRLNHQLYCVREHMGGFTGKRGLVLIDEASTREVKVTNHQKHRAASANNRPRYQKRF